MKKLLGLFKKWFGSSKGFTLIELLVVIAILGVLLVGSIVAINPKQKIDQAKDATAKGSIDQVATALQAWSTQNSGGYPSKANFDAKILVTSGELKSMPVGPDDTALSYATGGTVDSYGNYPDVAVSFTLLNTDSTTPGCTVSPYCTKWCWTSTLGKAKVSTAALCVP